jgi:hypothetical protein
MSIGLTTKTCFRYSVAKLAFELVVKTANEDDFTVHLASVDGDDVVATRDHLNAAGLVEVVTRQVQRRKVSGVAYPLEKVQGQVLTSDCAGDFRRIGLDSAAMWHHDAGACAIARNADDAVVLIELVNRCKFRERPKIRSGNQ